MGGGCRAGKLNSDALVRPGPCSIGRIVELGGAGRDARQKQMTKTGVAVVVAVFAVGAGCIAPGDTGQVAGAQVGVGQVGAGQGSVGEVGAVQAVAAQVGVGQVGAAEVDVVHDKVSDIGAGQGSATKVGEA